MKKIIVMSIAASLFLVACDEGKEEEEKVIHLPKVRVAKADVRDFDHWVELLGTVESYEDARLMPLLGGKITRLTVKDGQSVRAGQVIAVMDNELVGKQLDELQVQIENATYVFNKQKELKEAGVGTEFEETQAKNQLAALFQKEQTLRAQLGKSSVTAPFKGVVNEVYAHQGEIGGPGMPICHLVGLDNITVKASVSESYLMKVDTGTQVEIYLPALDTTLRDLTVDRVSKYVNPGNRTFQVFIDIPNPQGKILPNLMAKVRIKDDTYPNKTVVNNSSIQYDKDGKTFLFALNKLKSEKGKFVASKIKVKTVSSFGGFTAIERVEGVKKGRMIVLEGAEGIEDKDTVQILK